MTDRGRLARAHAANVLTIILMAVLTALLVNSEASNRRYRAQAMDLEIMLRKERGKVRTCVARRLDALESRVGAIPEKEVRNVYQARLADVRDRFTFGLRGPVAPAGPAAAPVPVASTTARSDEACPYSEEEAVNARATAQQLAALQAWVRENMGDVK